jgi:presenilin-like A22 family membrane protease
MKHTVKITAILISMFILTQLIGLAVVSYYQSPDNPLPYGMEPPEVTEETAFSFLTTLVIAFVLAILIIFLIMNFRKVWLMRIWFFLVVILALGITFNAAGNSLKIPYTFIWATALAVILASIKVFKRDILIHNITELAIYPGIASVFVPILNIWTIILLLIAISIYDIWAVWHSGIMQKMAKFQMDQVKVFGGFFVPYANKKMKEKIKLLKAKYKNQKTLEKHAKKQKIRVNLAILGGGDVVFPIIAAGVFFKTTGSLALTLLVPLGAVLGLLYLFTISKKKKFYPAMPFITAGIFAGMLVAALLSMI